MSITKKVGSPLNGPANSEILNQSNIHGEFYLKTNKYLVSFPGVKWPGCGKDYPPLSSTKVKERVEL